MGDFGTRFGLGFVWFLGLHFGSQLQANGIVSLTAFLLLPPGQVHQAGVDWERVSLLGCCTNIALYCFKLIAIICFN